MKKSSPLGILIVVFVWALMPNFIGGYYFPLTFTLINTTILFVFMYLFIMRNGRLMELYRYNGVFKASIVMLIYGWLIMFLRGKAASEIVVINQYFLYQFLVFGVFYTLSTNANKRINIFRLLLVASIIQLILSYLSFSFPTNQYIQYLQIYEGREASIDSSYLDLGRKVGVFSGPLSFAKFCALSSSIYISMFLFSSKLKYKVIYLGLIVLSVLGIIMTLSRSPFIALILTILISSIYFTPLIKGKNGKFITVFIMFIILPFTYSLLSNIIEVRGSIGENERFDILKSIWLYFKNEITLNDIFFGMGFEKLRGIIGLSHIHNIYLDLLLIFGLPIAILWYWFFFKFFKKLAVFSKNISNTYKKNNIISTDSMILYTTFLNFIYISIEGLAETGPWRDIRQAFLFWAFLGISAAIVRDYQKKKLQSQ